MDLKETAAAGNAAVFKKQRHGRRSRDEIIIGPKPGRLSQLTGPPLNRLEKLLQEEEI
jgi:hypothetical protein